MNEIRRTTWPSTRVVCFGGIRYDRGQRVSFPSCSRSVRGSWWYSRVTLGQIGCRHRACQNRCSQTTPDIWVCRFEAGEISLSWQSDLFVADETCADDCLCNPDSPDPLTDSAYGDKNLQIWPRKSRRNRSVGINAIPPRVMANTITSAAMSSR